MAAVGVDTLRVGAECSVVNPSAEGWVVTRAFTEAGEAETRRRRRLDSGPVLDVIAGTAWVEASIPKWLEGDAVSVPVDRAVEVGGDWIDEASEFVEWLDDPRVNRLDVVRDFEVGAGLDAGLVIGALSTIPVKGRKTKAHYRDPSRRDAQTLHVRTKRSGMGRLYDKGRESGRPELEGVVRFEAQERRRSLNGIELAALGEGTVERLGRRRFEWCGFDHRTSTLRGVIDRAMMLDDVGEGTRLQLVGYAALLDAGFGGRLERTRDYRLRRLLEDVGVPAPVDLVLDWDEGLIAA